MARTIITTSVPYKNIATHHAFMQAIGFRMASTPKAIGTPDNKQFRTSWAHVTWETATLDQKVEWLMQLLLHHRSMS